MGSARARGSPAASILWTIVKESVIAASVEQDINNDVVLLWR
jgi:hypothetical protein